MRRREFIALLGSGAAAWPLAAPAQQPAVPVVGFLNALSPDSTGHLVAAFRQGLNEAGFVEGKNVAMEYRWADGQYDRLAGLAAELVQRHVSVLAVGGGQAAAIAAKAATATIPIVFDTNYDPIKLGLVSSFNRPGGNATGVSFFTVTLDAKRLELLHDLLGSKAITIAVLVNPDNPDTEQVLPRMNEAVRALGLQYYVLKANNELDLDAAFADLVRRRVDAVLVTTDAFFTGARNRLVSLAARYAIPAIYGRREFATAGGLISYGENLAEAYRQVGVYVAKILQGAKPADLPVMQLTKFELVINLKTAKALGLTVPPTLFATADEVIE